MQALVVSAEKPGEISWVRDCARPVPTPGDVLVRVRLAGVCATDLEIVRGYMAFAGIPGHEFVGDVEGGPPALRGHRIVAEINCGCRRCDLCHRGLQDHCPQRTTLGIAGRGGAFAEYLTVPADNCHLVPDSISDQQAVFVEPLAAAAHVLDAFAPGADTQTAVIGTGRLGLLVAQVLALQPGRLDVIGRNPHTLDLCRRWGLHALSQGDVPRAGAYDVVVECTGSPAGLRMALMLCRPRGTIVLKSTYAGAAAHDLAPVVINEVQVVGNRCGAFGPALRLLAEGRIRVDEMIAAEYPLSKGVEALAAAGRPGCLKVLIRPGAA